MTREAPGAPTVVAQTNLQLYDQLRARSSAQRELGHERVAEVDVRTLLLEELHHAHGAGVANVAHAGLERRTPAKHARAVDRATDAVREMSMRCIT